MNPNPALWQTALRYCGVPPHAWSSYQHELEALLPILENCAQFRLTYRIFECEPTDQGISLKPDGLLLPGTLARTMLADCHHVLLLGATLGAGFDRQLRLFELQDPAKALLFDSLGSAYIDEKLDEWSCTIQSELSPWQIGDRFSCGYGDLPIELQKPIGTLLDLSHQCGIHVLDSCMMSPTKSVTALIGLADHPLPARIRGCAHCSLAKRCPYRKGGTTCHV